MKPRTIYNESILSLQYGHKCEDRTTTQHFCLQHCWAKAITRACTRFYQHTLMLQMYCSGPDNYCICSLTSRHAFALLVKAIITRNAKQERIKTSWSAKICATCRYGLLVKVASGHRLRLLSFSAALHMCFCLKRSIRVAWDCQGVPTAANTSTGAFAPQATCAASCSCHLSFPNPLPNSKAPLFKRLFTITIHPHNACKHFAFLTAHTRNRSMLRCSQSSIGTSSKS